MDFTSSFVKPTSFVNSPFDVQGFKNILETLKKSKQQQETKARPPLGAEQQYG